jgi:hypothetical protein
MSEEFGVAENELAKSVEAENKEPDNKGEEMQTAQLIDELNEVSVSDEPYTQADVMKRGERLIFALNRLILILEKVKLADYVELMKHKKILFFRSFTSGIFQGIGFALGFWLLSALALYILNEIVNLGIPVIGDFIAQLLVYVESVQKARGL